jgi:hypothetical protein
MATFTNFSPPPSQGRGGSKMADYANQATIAKTQGKDFTPMDYLKQSNPFVNYMSAAKPAANDLGNELASGTAAAAGAGAKAAGIW